MKAGLPQLEPKLLERWAKLGLYQRLREAAKGRPKFILHDGPPYANGNIHIGTALNKILKDMVTRSQQMLGFDSNYVPGWDCHGLPIEWKIEEQYRAKGQRQGHGAGQRVPRASAARSPSSGSACSARSSSAWASRATGSTTTRPWPTRPRPRSPRELMKFAMNGALYRGSKPVMWSVVEKTALAEAEVEYHDYTSDTVWVKFPVVQREFSGAAQSTTRTKSRCSRTCCLNASVVIWTTTPWTSPATARSASHPKIEYGLYEVTEAPEGNWAKPGDKLILADKLAAAVMKSAKVESFESWQMLRRRCFGLL